MFDILYLFTFDREKCYNTLFALTEKHFRFKWYASISQVDWNMNSVSLIVYFDFLSTCFISPVNEPIGMMISTISFNNSLCPYKLFCHVPFQLDVFFHESIYVIFYRNGSGSIWINIHFLSKINSQVVNLPCHWSFLSQNTCTVKSYHTCNSTSLNFQQWIAHVIFLPNYGDHLERVMWITFRK